MSSDDYGPESDPYCAHWISIFDEDHVKDNVRCENCGESCREHPVLWGGWCPTAPDGATDRERNTFKNAAWPFGDTKPLTGHRYRSPRT